jgi:aminopeptidase N
MRRAMTVALLALAAAGPDDRLDRTPGKLPKTVVPSAYAIALQTDPKAGRLSGHVDIDVTARAPVDAITLDVAALTVGRATVDGQAAQVEADASRQTVTLRLPAQIAAGPHRVAIDYTGPIPHTPAGIYLNDYANRGAQKRMLVTQFESIDARRMVPCWDEPAFKATFQLTVDVPGNYVAVSNTPATSQTRQADGSLRVAFARTPRMSSYLLALVAGEMDAIRGRAGATEAAVWAPTGQAERGRLALQTETALLPYYGTYFGVAYPLPKLDLLAIPGNFAAGAMENWGAITFIDSALLYDPATSSADTPEDVVLTVSHEMAHQWSGDLVTMAWWDDLWLNEGFATWMEYKATDRLHPEWHIWPRRHASREEAMGQDALPASHPIRTAITDESEVDNAFDAISYQKGAAVIRMIEEWIGPDVFRNGMRRYMQAHQYANATSDDLWEALSAASAKPVTAVARRFVDQPGVPLIAVSTACEGGGTLALTLRQDRFTVHDPHPLHLVWQVPVTVAAEGGTASAQALVGEAPVTLRLPGCDTVAKVNPGEAGYYRVQYDRAAFGRLRAAFARLPEADRANLLGDQYALAQAGRAPLADFLDLTRGLGGEDSLAVWSEVIARLEAIDTLERGTPERTAWRAYARGLLSPVLARLGWTPRAGEGPLETRLRALVVEALGRFDDPATVARAQALFAQLRKDPASVPASLADAVCLIAGAHADAATWEALRDMAAAANDSETKLRYLNAMAAARDPALAARSVALAASPDLSPGLMGRMLGAMGEYGDDPDALWHSILGRKAEILSRLPEGFRGLMLPYAASGSADPAVAEEMLAQPEVKANAGARQAGEREAARIEARAETAARFRPAVAAWLHAQG